VGVVDPIRPWRGAAAHAVNNRPPRKDPRVIVWTGINALFAGVAIFGLQSDVWEAFITLFLASTLLQILWMRRNVR
jgi:hypothetical protein